MTNYSGTQANILCELEEITNLYNFGLQLGIDTRVLDRIDRDHRNDVERQRSEIIKYWYRNTEESERTWGRVADAIRRLGGHHNLETRLRQLPITTTVTGKEASSYSYLARPSSHNDAAKVCYYIIYRNAIFTLYGNYYIGMCKNGDCTSLVLIHC